MPLVSSVSSDFEWTYHRLSSLCTLSHFLSVLPYRVHATHQNNQHLSVSSSHVEVVVVEILSSVCRFVGLQRMKQSHKNKPPKNWSQFSCDFQSPAFNRDYIYGNVHPSILYESIIYSEIFPAAAVVKNEQS